VRPVRDRRGLVQQAAQPSARRAGAGRGPDGLDERCERLDHRDRREDQQTLDRQRDGEVVDQQRGHRRRGADQDEDRRRGQGPATALSRRRPFERVLGGRQPVEDRFSRAGHADLFGLPGHELSRGQHLPPRGEERRLSRRLEPLRDETYERRADDQRGDGQPHR
jgi:hypothetical protein